MTANTETTIGKKTRFQTFQRPNLKAALRLFLAVGPSMLLAYAFHVGHQVYLADYTNASFYQNRFGAAIALACHGQYSRVERSATVNSFLSGKADELNCAEVELLPQEPLHRFQQRNRALLIAAGLVWRWNGVSWPALSMLAGVLVLLFAGGLYAVMRALRCSSGVSMVASVSALHLSALREYVPELRDFSKASFIMLAIALLAVLIRRGVTAKNSLIAAGAFGVVVVAGYAFRSDMRIFLFLTPLVVMIFPTRDTFREHVKQAGRVLGVFYMTYFAGILALPYLFLRHVSLEPHVALLGTAEYYWDRLGLVFSSYFPMERAYDAQIWQMVNLYQGSYIGETILFKSMEYASATKETLLAYVSVFPYDLYMRAFYSLGVLKQMAPFTYLWGVPLFVLLFVAALREKRIAAFLVLVVAFFTGLSTVQFQDRHLFYLGAFGVVLIAVAASAVLWFISRLVESRSFEPLRRSIGGVKSIVIFVAVILLCGQLTASLLSYVQQRNLSRLVGRYEALEWRPIGNAEEDGRVDFEPGFPINGVPVSSLDEIVNKGAPYRRAKAGTLARLRVSFPEPCSPGELHFRRFIEAWGMSYRVDRRAFHGCETTDYYFPVHFYYNNDSTELQVLKLPSGAIAELSIADSSKLLPAELIVQNGRLTNLHVEGSFSEGVKRLFYR